MNDVKHRKWLVLKKNTGTNIDLKKVLASIVNHFMGELSVIIAKYLFKMHSENETTKRRKSVITRERKRDQSKLGTQSKKGGEGKKREKK